jgi:hypothetical protein
MEQSLHCNGRRQSKSIGLQFSHTPRNELSGHNWNRRDSTKIKDYPRSARFQTMFALVMTTLIENINFIFRLIDMY